VETQRQRRQMGGHIQVGKDGWWLGSCRDSRSGRIRRICLGKVVKRISRTFLMLSQKRTRKFLRNGYKFREKKLLRTKKKFINLKTRKSLFSSGDIS
jgi:hypothetical protein